MLWAQTSHDFLKAYVTGDDNDVCSRRDWKYVRKLLTDPEW